MTFSVIRTGPVRHCSCIVLTIAMATGPSAGVVAQLPAEELPSDLGPRPHDLPLDVEEPPLHLLRGDTTLLAAPLAGKIDLRYVVPQAVALVVVRPRQVLTSEAAAMMPVEVAAAAGLKYLGIDPADVDEVMLSIEPPTAGPPEAMLVARLSTPFQGERLSEKLRGHTQPAELAGKHYLQSRHPMLPSFYMPNTKTLLVARDATLRRVLEPASEPPSSPLFDRVREFAGGNDLYAAVDFESLRPMINGMISMAVAQQEDSFPDEAKPFLEVPNLVSAADLTINLATPGPTMLVVHANDAASADRLEELLDEAKELRRRTVAADVARMQQSEDAIERAFGKYLERISDASADTFRPERKDSSLILFQGSEMDSRAQRQLVFVAVSGILVALLLPAVQAAREAARRNQSMNNMKQLMLALLVYHDAKRSFPAHASYDDEGKPLLSWRVHILPYLEHSALYKQFRLDEPWDSPHNRALVAHMPDVFKNPNLAVEPGQTNYLAVVGEDCVFDGSPNGMSIRDVTDGTSNTIVLVEADAGRAVEWTRPADWELDPNQPAAGLGQLRPGGWLAGWADGHVSFIANDSAREIVKALFTRAGGEVVEVP